MEALKKALTVVDKATGNAVISINKKTDTSLAHIASFRPVDNHITPHDAGMHHGNGFDSNARLGFKYPLNPLAKYIYKGVGHAKARPNRRLKKIISLRHVQLSRLSQVKQFTMPYTVHHHVHYYQANALQYVYLIAKAHRGTAVGLREAMAEIAQSIVSGGISANAVIRFAKRHQGNNR